MARNCEKKFIGLNRMFIEKQQKEELEKNPKRPSLHKLHSASEVKKWIPNIKREIEYNLQQLSGARKHKYPDYKIQEFQDNVERLEKQYKSFVTKVFQLDPSTTGIPWQPRGYVSKRKPVDNANPILPKKICTPLLDNEDDDKTMAVPDYQSSSKSHQDTKTDDIQETNTSVITSHPKKNSPKKSVEEQRENPSILGLDYSSSDDD